MTLGECINNYLNEHNMSMRKFASVAEISHAYISNIVNGKTSRGNVPVPSIDVYRSIAKAMGIDVNTLISMVDDEIAWGEQKTDVLFAVGTYETDLLTKFRLLSEIGKMKILLTVYQELQAEQAPAEEKDAAQLSTSKGG